jgi:hypothetical protein
MLLLTDLMLKPASETGDHYEVTANGDIVRHVMLSGLPLRESHLGPGRLFLLTMEIEARPKATRRLLKLPCRRSPGAGIAIDELI